MKKTVYNFEDILSDLNKKVKDLTIEDLYYIYETYSVAVVIDLLNKQIKIEKED